MARLTLVLVGFWPCIGIRRTGLGGRSPAQWASGSVLILCNHLSWLDILFLMSEGYSPSFVAKSGFLQAPMVGWFAVTLFDCVPVTSKEPEASGAEAGGESPAPERPSAPIGSHFGPREHGPLQLCKHQSEF